MRQAMVSSAPRQAPPPRRYSHDDRPRALRRPSAEADRRSQAHHWPRSVRRGHHPRGARAPRVPSQPARARPGERAPDRRGAQGARASCAWRPPADLGSLRPLPFMATIPGLKHARCPYLAGDVVDSTGVPVAAIVAETAALARDAAEMVEVDYEPLAPIADPERGLQPGAPLAHTELGTNQAFSWPLKGGDVDGAFGRAAHIVKVRLDHNRLAGAPMEPRGVLARYDAGTGELTLWLTTQNPFLSRADLAAGSGFPGAQAARDRARRRRRLRGEGASVSRGDRRRGAARGMSAGRSAGCPRAPRTCSRRSRRAPPSRRPKAR